MNNHHLYLVLAIKAAIQQNNLKRFLFPVVLAYLGFLLNPCNAVTMIEEIACQQFSSWCKDTCILKEVYRFFLVVYQLWYIFMCLWLVFLIFLKVEGIFRINAENDQELLVREQLNGGTVPHRIDLHCLAGLIKVSPSNLFWVVD